MAFEASQVMSGHIEHSFCFEQPWSSVNKMFKNAHINNDMKKHLTQKLIKPGQLNGNPKLHKKGRPLRTIVNGIGTPTERMAEVAEKQLEEYVVNSPSYIRDKTDFLCKLEEIKQTIPDMLLSSALTLKSYILPFQAKSRKYQGVFEVKSRVKTWQVRGIGLNNWSISKSQNGGQNQVSGRVSVPCWLATPVANAPWKPLIIRWRSSSV